MIPDYYYNPLFLYAKAYVVDQFNSCAKHSIKIDYNRDILICDTCKVVLAPVSSLLTKLYSLHSKHIECNNPSTGDVSFLNSSDLDDEYSFFVKLNSLSNFSSSIGTKCNHNIKEYTGLTQRYNYCTICDEKFY